MKNNYSPDILNCLANLSSDEVFTSPELANRMLDLLPQELFRSSKTRFLDPCSKSGVFLREIAKRLLAGLEEQIPDLQQRIDHIMTQQVFGIACTDLTAEMSRRTLYCTKQANGEYSVATCFNDAQGNLRYMRCQHTWENGKCKHCGANRAQYDRVETIESYAYPFIHKSIKEIFKRDMQFDVIIGNPPYQLDDGGAQASASPIYQLFVQQSLKLNPRYLSMIIPARWYGGGKGLDDFRKEMIENRNIRVLHDFLNAADCFPGVEIKGGVCYFLWNRDQSGKCNIYTHTGERVIEQKPRFLKEIGSDVFIRYEIGVDILNKVRIHQEKTVDGIVSSQKPFGLRTFVQGQAQPFKDCVTLYQNGGIGYIKKEQIEKGIGLVDKHKIYVSRAYNAGDNYPHQIIGKPIYGAPNTCCTETYVTIGPFVNKTESENFISYLSTRFFRFMVFLSKVSQMAPAKVYQFVPLQDFSHPWTDEMLYKKYDLDKDEIAFIESMIRPME